MAVGAIVLVAVLLPTIWAPAVESGRAGFAPLPRSGVPPHSGVGAPADRSLLDREDASTTGRLPYAPEPGVPLPLTGNSTFLGQLFGIPYAGGPPTPIANDTVTILDIDRTTVLASTLTNASGAYSVSIGRTGEFYVNSAPTGPWGGGWPASPAALSPTDFATFGQVSVNLFAYPRISYDNATFDLPGWNNLSTYLDNGNGNTSATYIQQPVLSWVQDGVYYINASDDLVFYSFANRTVTFLHSWLMLYTNLMSYAGWQNEFFLTQDGQYAYGAGCLGRCSSSALVTFFAVNLTTDQSFEHTFETFNVTYTVSNAQVNMVGVDGNASTAVLITDTGGLHMWNVWNDTEWVGGRLTYFEANNVYWVPYLNSFINFQAEGSRGDHLEQWRLTLDGSFVQTFSGQWYTGAFDANGVNGLYLNVTSHLLWTGVDYHGGIQTFAYNWSSNGTLDDEVYFYQSPANDSKYPNPVLIPQISSDEHRFTVVSSGPAFQTAWWPYGGNDSFVVDPVPGQIAFYSSNVSVDHLDNATYYPTQAYAHSYSLDGQFFNTSRLVTYYSYDCASNFNKNTTCPVAGSSPGTVPGTLYYVWRTGQSEFPTPTTNGQAETSAPPEPVLSLAKGADWINVSWNESESPIVNFTVLWGTNATNLSHSESVFAQNSSMNETGLLPGHTYYFRVSALNLHSEDAGASIHGTLAPNPALPTDLRTAAVNATNVTLVWTNPYETLLNDTVYVGSTCGPWTSVDSIGVTTRFLVANLSPLTHYCFAVAAWNSSGETSLSTPAVATTSGFPQAPTGLRVLPETTTSALLLWVNPPGGVVNVTIYLGLSCGNWSSEISAGAVTQYFLAGLHPNTVYCTTVGAWNDSGEGTRTLPIPLHTVPLVPSEATNLTIAAVNSTAVTLMWVLPAETADSGFQNVSLYRGAQCDQWTTVTSLGGVVNSWRVGGLAPFSTYVWAVAVWNGSGEGSLSECVSATTLADSNGVPHGTITNLTLVAIAPSSATLGWTYEPSPAAEGGENASYFVVFVGSSCATPAFSPVVHGSPTTVTGLLPATEYCFSVTAFFGDGTTVSGTSVSDQTPGLTTLTQGNPFPATPSLWVLGGLAAVVVALVAVERLLNRRRVRRT
ncbi:MAG: fibronectin type III domain-containing protein [Thermoplasmata archaeon]|nr:fibronectin type III domain-containing protein [Thermoplasmata archaeon]